MADEIHVYEPGSVMIMTSGEYSDYHIQGVLIAEKRCDITELMDACRASCALQIEENEPGPSEFVAWLVAAGWAKPFDHAEVHVGSYGELKI